MNLTLIDPYEISKEDCPIFIQAADIRIKSNWNHSMICRLPGKLVSQNRTYKEIDVGVYMKPGMMMKFWVCKDITVEEKNAIMIKIQHELNQPWHKRMYDWAGIVGQFFGMRWFNIPSLNYCSERVLSKIKVIIPNELKHPTPEDIDQLFKESPRMKLLGYWMDH